MADVNRGDRPLSPHLQIYKPQLTSITSILTRITGNALIVGALLLVWWMLAASAGPEYFAFVDGIVTSWLGKLVFLGSIWALWYHALAGIRHLIWDTGRGFDLKDAYAMGYMVIGGSVVLTLVTIVAL